MGTAFRAAGGDRAQLGHNTSADLQYWASGCSTYLDAQAAVLAQVATDFPTGLPGDLVVESVHPRSTEAAGEWDCSVRAVHPSAKKEDPPATGESNYRFEFGGGTRRIFTSLKTLNKYGPFGAGAPSCHNLIGVTRDGVEGCDLGDTSGAYQFSETHYLSAATVTNTYKGDVFDLVWKTNNASFKGFDAGQVLFLGCSGGRRGAGDWEITFKFAAKPDVADACADWDALLGFGVGHGSGAVAIAVPAWYYMWVLYHDVHDAALHVVVKRPRYVYVEQLYQSGGFSTLGIGTT
ncbi:MAG TPA: hypothetical protein PLP01_12885 [Phycisphaerae bacterium]|nr:hypothetical protein [Phycisphaerae bacterium]HOI56140.1 hypothetical protein [Phycisphaerae bacterium]